MAKWHDYKEGVTKALISFGVPFRKAELAVLDLQIKLKEGWDNKLSPEQTARLMFSEVKRIYKFDLQS